MANNLISSIQYNSGDIGVFTTPYGVCSTGASTAAKTVTVNGDFALETGARVIVQFKYGNSASTITLNVNSTGAKNVWLDDDNQGSSIQTYIKAGWLGRAYEFIYDGTQYRLLTYDSNTVYTAPTAFGKYISASGIVLGTNLTSNTVSTYGGGNSIAAGSSNVFSQNVALCYAFGESNNITDTSTEGTSEGVTKYTFFAGYGNKLNTTYPKTTGSVAIGLNNIICSGKTSSPSSITGSSSHLCASVALGASNTVGSSSSAGYAIGAGNTVGGAGASAMGRQNTSSGSASVAMGYSNTASGSYSVALGYTNTASGGYSAAIGESNTATASDSFAFGYSNDATNTGAVAIGYNTTASGIYSIALGRNLTANARQTILGYYNSTTTGPSSDGKLTASATNASTIFQFGAGSSSTKGNVMSLLNNGDVYFTGDLSANNADYAECFEWSDGNFKKEDRRGRFVTIDNNDKIRFATSNDDYILGVVSGAPVIVGDACSEEWHDKYLRDIYGAYLYEIIDYPAEYDEDGNITVEAYSEVVRKPNPNYDHNEKYIPRRHRPEWSAIGMMGKLVLDDDGTCEVGGFAVPGKDGIATRGTSINGYKVIARLDENHIRVIFR